MNLPRQIHVVQSMTDKWPSGLIDADEAAKDIFISAQRLTDLADGGFAPHYRIDGGKPLFRKSDLKEWAARYLVQKYESKKFDSPVIQLVVENKRLFDLGNVPSSLKRIYQLQNITGEFRRSGIYFLCVNGDVQYVGQAVCVYNRIAQHVMTDKFTDVDSVFFLPWPSDDLDRIEGALIRTIRPVRNGQLKTGAMVAPKGDHQNDSQILSSIGFIQSGDLNG